MVEEQIQFLITYTMIHTPAGLYIWLMTSLIHIMNGI